MRHKALYFFDKVIIYVTIITIVYYYNNKLIKDGENHANLV